MKKRTALFLAGSLLIGCHHAKPIPKPAGIVSDDPNKVWMAASPVQCLGNPWEKDWLKAHHNKGSLYPMHDETKVMKDFFTKNGFMIYDLRLRPYMHDKQLCRACNCSRGDLLLILVPKDDASLLTHYGFQSTVPLGVSTPGKK